MKKIIAKNGSTQKLFEYDELCDIFNFTPQCKNDVTRTTKAYFEYVNNVYAGNDGALGIVAEPFSRRPQSLKSDLARASQNGNPKPDCWVIIDGRRTKVEKKTNGGRIDDITNKYIVYTLCFWNSTGHCVKAPRIMKTDTFINKLYELNAIKAINKNGILDGHGIQLSKRGLWAWLETQPIYSHELEYNSSDFE